MEWPVSARLGAQPIATHGVAEAVVPLGEAAGKAAQLIALVPRIPGFGDPMHLCERRVLAQGHEERRRRVEAVARSPQGGGQIKAEAIDAHGLHPERMTSSANCVVRGWISRSVLPQPLAFS